jgi:hypothetical protein
MGDGPDPKSAGKPRDDLQNPITHEGAPAERHDGNEAADDRVEVVEPDGDITPRLPNKGGRTPPEDEDPSRKEDPAV